MKIDFNIVSKIYVSEVDNKRLIKKIISGSDFDGCIICRFVKFYWNK